LHRPLTRCRTAPLLQVTSPGGLLAPSSCSSHVDSATFLELVREALRKVQRRGTVLGVYGQPLDHPYPLAAEELRYLKFALVQLD
jgi:23S rRNA (cytosine1962-C5)-methyltransferase